MLATEEFVRICDVFEKNDMIGVPLNPRGVPSKTMLAHCCAGEYETI